jgi:hypothetical protein
MRPLLSIALVVLLPLRASAAGTPAPAPPVPLPGFVVTGPASVEDVHVTIACAGTNLADDSSLCHVEVHATLRAIAAVQIRLPETGTTTIAGDVVTGFLALAPGRVASLTLAFDRDLTVETHDADSPWILPAPRARHLLLGESSASRREGDFASGELFGGAEVVIVGPLQVDASPGAVHARIGGIVVDGHADVVDPRGAITLDVSANEEPARVLQNGGPFVGLGIWGPLDGDGLVALRVGYEIAFFDWVLASLSFETNFDSIAESVLVEVATPELAILIPSISIGVGAVLRQLGDRDADVALRLATGYQYACMGAYADFDYWPDVGGWTLAVGGRISI